MERTARGVMEYMEAQRRGWDISCFYRVVFCLQVYEVLEFKLQRILLLPVDSVAALLNVKVLISSLHFFDPPPFTIKM